MPTGGEFNNGFMGTYSGTVNFTDTTPASLPTVGAFIVTGTAIGGGIINTSSGLNTGTATTQGYVFIRGSSAQARDIQWQTGTQPRWVIRVSGAEGGADTGALIELLARTDAGTLIDNPLSIVRAAGGPVSIGSANRPVKFPVVTVATLPAAPGAGSRMFVSDALTPTPGAAVAGGGAVTVPVYYTGVAWFVG